MLKIDTIKTFLTKDTLKEYFKIGLLVVMVMTIFSSITLYSTYNTSLEKYDSRLNDVSRLNGDDINLICNVVTCTYLKNKSGTIYKNINGVLRKVDILKDDVFKPMYVGVFNSTYNTVIPYNGNIIVIDDSAYFLSVNKLMYINYIFLFLFYTIPFFIYKYERIKILEIRDKTSSDELEISLQRDLAESLNHEITLHVVVLRNIVTGLYNKLIRIRSSTENCCEVMFTNDTIVNLNAMYRNGILAIETIEEVLSTISDSKKLKYTEKESSLYELLNTVEASINSLSVRKIKVTITEGIAISKKYRPCRELGNSKTARIFKNNIVNSKEAKANKVSILIKLIKDNTYVEVLLVDNGIGIQNYDGTILTKPEIIFEQGVTTKKANGELVNNKNHVSRSRGIGAFINKRELESIGGTITILRTSKQGTIFRITFPIKKIKE